MNRLLAPLIFFTRVPFWRLREVPAAYFDRVVDFWPFVGWLTGGAMAATVLLASLALPMPAAVAAAFAVRLLMTGALHEDGLADFFDGLGGGVTRERILEIMKDSHIGTYGMIGLVMYFLLAVTLLGGLPPALCAAGMLAGDTWAKLCASRIVNVLPYARKESKSKIIYKPMSWQTRVVTLVIGVLPMFLLPWVYFLCMVMPIVVSRLLFYIMRKRIGGYTGDCCGATFLLCELSFYISLAAVFGIV